MESIRWGGGGDVKRERERGTGLWWARGRGVEEGGLGGVAYNSKLIFQLGDAEA